MASVTAQVWNRIIASIMVTWRTPLFVRLRGGLLIALGLAALIAFVSYNPADPSLNTQTDKAPTNLLGDFGAVLADLALQSLGLAAWPAALFLIFFGYLRAADPEPARSRGFLRRRALFAFIGLVALSAALAVFSTKGAGDVLRPIGGFWGSGLHEAIGAGLAFLRLPAPLSFSALLWGILAFVLLNMAIGMRPRHYKGFGQGFGQWFSQAALPVMASMVSGRGRGQDPEPAYGFAQAPDRDTPIARSREPEPRAPEYKAPKSQGPVNPFEGDDQFSQTPVIPARSAEASDPDMNEEEDGLSVAIPRPDVQSGPAPRVLDIKLPKPSSREVRENQTAFDFVRPDGFRLPELSMLSKPEVRASTFDEDALRQNARMLEGVLAEFGVRGVIDQIRPGPVVTLYELAPAPGVKHARVVALSDDIARSMSARACRVSVVQGRNAIGIELPNAKREMVYLRDLLASSDYEKTSHVLPMALGESIGGEPYIADLARMPHLLIAGTTGSGKSVGVNAMILSILYRLPPDQCRFIMIDPKMLELSIYDGIPHLLAPVVTDPKKAVVALKWTVREMEDRYRRMSKINVRNVASYNEKAKEALARGEHFVRTVQTGFDDNGRPIFEEEKITPEPMPYLVVVVDEVADLMMVAGKDIEGAVQRLAQMARAAGIHLIMATQRPSVDVITGTIKANFPTRISFQVTSKIDSRTILGEQGAEQLLGQGDMLFMAGGGRITRLHGPFVSDGEVEAVATYLKDQGEPQYLDDVTEGDDDEDGGGGEWGEGGTSGDDLYDRAVAVVTRDRKASTSYVQRRLQIGYNRAASLIERMEQEGIISPANHAGKRDILVGAPPPV